MADPALLTGIVGTATAVIGVAAGIFASRREKARDDEEEAKERAAGSLASWNALTEALDREIRRLHEDMDRLRDEYERHLQAARRRISELEAEVATLKRLLRGEPE